MTPSDYAKTLTLYVGSLIKFRDIEAACGLDMKHFAGNRVKDWGHLSAQVRIEFRDELKRMGFHVKTETRRSQYRVIRNDDAVSTYCASGTNKRARATKQTIDNLEAVDDSTLSPEALAKKERKLARLRNAMVGHKERPYGVGLPGPDPLRPKLS